MPEPIRILFVGELQSSHALSWIDLLSPYKEEFEIKGFHVSPWSAPEASFPIIEAKDMSYFNLAQEYLKIDHLIFEDFYLYGLGVINSRQLINILYVIQKFKPHIVHTLGIFPASTFFLKAISFPNMDFVWNPAWIVQARGGADIALNRKRSDLAQQIQAIFQSCDYFIADNQQNYIFAADMGLADEKMSLLGPVPGAGGVDPAIFNGVPLPSRKQRLILWPKAYNCIQSNGLTVVEALRLALPHIGDFHLVATAAIPDVEYWFNAFLSNYGSHVEIHNRLPHSKLMHIYHSARVLLAPSLSDGIPNCLYEAMASHTVPILSPIDTLTPLFKDKVHTIYAPNLDPSAIADALITAMNNDALADDIAATNRAWLPTLAGRDVIRDRVVEMYRKVRQFKVSQLIVELIQAKNDLAKLQRIQSHPLIKFLKHII